jgi:hypothetical protein
MTILWNYTIKKNLIIVKVLKSFYSVNWVRLNEWVSPGVTTDVLSGVDLPFLRSGEDIWDFSFWSCILTLVTDDGNMAVTVDVTGRLFIIIGEDDSIRLVSELRITGERCCSI